MKTLSTRTNQRRSRTPFLALSIVLLVATAACGEGADATGNPLEGSKWEMTWVRDGDALVSANPTTIATAVFADGQAFGSTGCNGYGFSYAIDGNSITFKDRVLSGSACNPDYVEQGDAFIQAMQAAQRFVLSGDDLELTDAAGDAQVVFRPATELPLTWVDWQLVWYGGGTSPLAGTQISLAFRDDGTLIGIAGCNSYSAPYQTDGSSLVIGDVTQTAIGCLEPDGIMTQENDYLSALQQAVTFMTSLTSLELLDDEGNPVAEYGFGGRLR